MLFSAIIFRTFFGFICYVRNLMHLLNFYIFVHTSIPNLIMKLKPFNVTMAGNLTTPLHDLFSQNNIQIRFSCPHTSQQNRISKRMIHTINNVIRTILFQAHLPPIYWVEALHMAMHLLNLLLSTSVNNDISFIKLFGKTPSYSHLRVFRCFYYPPLVSSTQIGSSGHQVRLPRVPIPSAWLLVP